MEIKAKYYSNHGKAHYIEFESFDDYISKYNEDSKLGTIYASGIEAKFGDNLNYENLKSFKNLYEYCSNAIIQRKNHEKTLKSCLTVGDLIEELKKYNEDTKTFIKNKDKYLHPSRSLKEAQKIEEKEIKFYYDEILKVNGIVIENL